MFNMVVNGAKMAVDRIADFTPFGKLSPSIAIPRWPPGRFLTVLSEPALKSEWRISRGAGIHPRYF
jgi:hypothetical protein